MRKTLKNLLVEYGAVAVVVYLVIFFAVWTGFWAAIRSGWKPSGAAASVGVWTAAYLATKLTQPLRIAATIALTPFIARWYERAIAPLLTRKQGESAAREETARDEQKV